MRAIEHFKTITHHRHLVRQYCFRLGLYYQGLTHDLSKYSPSEFWRGVKYYQGYRSPNDAERRENGVSLTTLNTGSTTVSATTERSTWAGAKCRSNM